MGWFDKIYISFMERWGGVREERGERIVFINPFHTFEGRQGGEGERGEENGRGRERKEELFSLTHSTHCDLKTTEWGASSSELV